MGKRKYPPLKQSEMVAILTVLGFKLVRHGKHPVYELEADASGQRRVVPVDDYPEFDETLIKSMIQQNGFTRETFYGATKKTAKKIYA
jgi:predicted RNA binding protein YcfA (HicA-like mRNA interferase family)